jgi:transcriptional regulator with XRE-family HTH domain
MDPADWRRQAKKTLAEVAALVGCSSLSSVQRYETGEREAPNSISLAYRRISGGAVTPEDFENARKKYRRRTARRARSSAS